MLSSKVIKSGYYLLPRIKLLSTHERWRKMAKLLKLSRPAGLRLEWMICYETTARKNASLTCRHFGISRKTFYTWKGRFNELNLRSLEDQSKAPPYYAPKRVYFPAIPEIHCLKKAIYPLWQV